MARVPKATPPAKKPVTPRPSAPQARLTELRAMRGSIDGAIVKMQAARDRLSREIERLERGSVH